MIGSLMSRMGDAQKLSVPQLQKAIQSGVLPAYIGIPIIQDKLQQAKGAAQPVAPKSPIAQEILQQANQPQVGVEGLPSNLPTESMAGGGIVAFANGGLNDDEDEYEQAIEDEEFDRYQSLLDNAGHYVKAEDTSAPPTKSTENKGVGVNPNATGGIGIKDLLAAKAAQHKLPPALLHSIAGLESGGKETAANPRSSAKGLFQFTDSTWKGMGGKHGEQFDPEKNAELGALFTRQNAEGLKKSLGRDPTYGEVYAAHHFGLKGAKDLMGADPKTPIEMAVSPSVLKANPYLKDKSVGQVLAELNKKTGSGIVTLAEGGIAGLDQSDPSNAGIESAAPYYGYAAGGIAKLAQGGSVKHYDGTESSLVNVDPMGGYSGNYEAKDTTFDPFQESLARYKKDLEEKIKTKKALEGTSLEAPTTKTTTPAKDLGPGLTADEMIAGSTRAGTLAAMDKDTTSGMDLVKPAGIDQAVAKKETGGLDDLIERLNKREAGYGKQKSIDNYMALLSAGLGMMGGTSPHALANIGQGAMAGVQNLAESNKLRAAEQGNLDKTMATALRYREAQKAANQGREAALGLRYAELGEKQKTHIAGIMGNREKNAMAQATAYLKANPIAGLNADDPTAISDMANKLLARDPAYLKAYETYNGFGFALPSGGGGGGNTMRFDAKGNEIK